MRQIIQGDPKTINKDKGHVTVTWEDRVIVDQYETYKNGAQENTHADAAKGWEEHIEQICLEEENTNLSLRWFEYKGKNCGANPPLVVSLFEYFNTTWQRVADREGLVIVSFEYHRNGRPPEGGDGAIGYGPKPDEIVSYHYVVQQIIEKYNVDKRRVYFSGLSYGDLTTMMYVKKYGNELAASANMNGPSCGYNIKRLDLETLVPLPAIQIRSNDDTSCDGFPAGFAFPLEGNEEWVRNTRSHVVVQNRNVLLNTNKITSRLPELYTCKERMFGRYKSELGDVIFAEYTKHGHILPIDTAEVLWETVFSRYYRDTDGVIKQFNVPAPKVDRNAVALVAGSKKAYIDNKLVELSSECKILDEEGPVSFFVTLYVKTECSYSTFYAPIEILEKGFGIKYTVENLGTKSVPWISGKENEHLDLTDYVVKFEKDGDSFEIYTNTCVVMKNGRVLDLERPVLCVDGALMLPVAQIADLIGLYSEECNDAIYVADHKTSLGYTFSRLLREEILAEEPEENKFTLTVAPLEHGTLEIQNDSFDEGETLKITVKPDKGYVLKEMQSFINGLSLPVDHIKDDLWYVCNCFGDVEVAASFVEEGEENLQKLEFFY